MNHSNDKRTHFYSKLFAFAQKRKNIEKQRRHYFAYHQMHIAVKTFGGDRILVTRVVGHFAKRQIKNLP